MMPAALSHHARCAQPRDGGRRGTAATTTSHRRRRRRGLGAATAAAAAASSGDDPASPLQFWRKDMPVPTRLLSTDGGEPRAIYTIRLTTGDERGASLSESGAGVHILLVDESGAALLHRIPPIFDAASAAADAAALCASAGPAAGCDMPPKKAPAPTDESSDEGEPATTPLPARERFQRGSVDEVAFAGPALGKLAAMAACPEAGTWQVDEATVTATVLGGGCGAAAAPPDAARFLLGGSRAGERGSAALAPPVPPGAVVVGAGDAAAVLTPAQAAALRAAGLESYACLKDRALASGGALVAAGALASGVLGGVSSLVSWLVGGCAGLAYGWALQAGVDAVGGGVDGETVPRAAGRRGATTRPLPARLFGSPPARLALVAAIGLGALAVATKQSEGVGGVSVTADALAATAAASHGHARLALLRQLITAALGFSMYKVGLVATVAAADAGVAGPRRLLDRARRATDAEGGGESDDDDDDRGGSARAGAAAGGGGRDSSGGV